MQDKATSQQHDKIAIMYLSMLLLPAVVGFSLKSVITQRCVRTARYAHMVLMRNMLGFHLSMHAVVFCHRQARN